MEDFQYYDNSTDKNKQMNKLSINIAWYLL